MIRAISSELAEWLAMENAISENDRPLFAYAVYSLLFGLSPMFITIILGFIFDMVYEGIVLIVPFIFIRRFSGGQHLKSSVTCLILSTCLLIIAFFAIRIIRNCGSVSTISAAVLASIVSICIFSPIDSSARKLSSSQTRIFGTIARVLSIAFGGLYLLLVATGRQDIAVPLGIGITIPAILLVPCLIQKLYSWSKRLSALYKRPK